MSANLDRVRSISADWERGDFRRVEWASDDIEYTDVDGLSPGSVTGLKGMAAGRRDFMTDWDDFRAEAEEYRELDDRRVLVFHRSGRGKTSGVGVETQGAILLQVDEGKVTRLVRYWDLDRALADLGLTE